MTCYSSAKAIEVLSERVQEYSEQAESKVRLIERTKKAAEVSGFFICCGGEGGIRTLEAFRLTHFPGVLLRPLGHLSTLWFPGTLGVPQERRKW